MRIKILYFLVIMIFIFLALNLMSLTLFQGEKFRELSNKNCIRLIPQCGSRGNILDTNGALVVGSSISYNVVVLTQEREAMDKTFSGLSGILGISTEELWKKFRRGYSEPSVPVTIVSNISLEKVVALEERKLDLDGVIIQSTSLRSYPYGALASHVIGYLSEIDRWRLTKLVDYGYKTKDIVGMGGIEEKYDYYLRQDDGGLQVEVDHQGRFSRVRGFRQPHSGKDVQLTLDLRIQKITEEAMQGLSGAAVIMDPNSGEILAMASFPNFDPSLFVNKNNKFISRLFVDPQSPFLNRAVSGLYPPGSVFKPIVAAAGLESGKINMSTVYHCPGFLQVGRRDFKCWDTHLDQDLLQAIAHSCDVFFYKIGLAVGPQSLHDYAVKFGLTRPTGIELPYEESGFIPNPIWKKIYRFQKWYDGDTANFAIGQGEVLVTPIQMCRMMAVFANKGSLVTPYIIKAIDGQDVSANHRRVVPMHIKGTIINNINKGLRGVVSEAKGTANILANLGVSVAGKTGTAQNPRGLSHGWFVGYAPYENPRYVICVFSEHGAHGYASAVVAKNIFEAMMQEGLL
jgi:penicillin-binding protein 2